MMKSSERPSTHSDHYTLNEVAERLGIHYMTAYKYVRTGKLPAAKVGGGWLVNKGDLNAFVNHSPKGTSKERVDWSVRLGDRLIAGDEQGAWSVVESALASGKTPASVYVDVLSPALAAIGAGWAIGEISIAEEHRATAVTNRIIGRLGPRFHRPGRTRGTIVLGAVAGDQHAVPIALAADLLRGQGFSVMDLGANCPIESFVDAGLAADRLIAIGISSTASGVDSNVIATADAVTTEVGCPVVIGGHGIGVEARRVFGDSVTSSADEMIRAFERLAGETSTS